MFGAGAPTSPLAEGAAKSKSPTSSSMSGGSGGGAASGGARGSRGGGDEDDAGEANTSKRAITPPERPSEYVDIAEMNGHFANKDKLWGLCSSYLPSDVPSLQRALVQHVEYTLARRRYKFDRTSFYQATAYSVRDRLIERWTDTQQFYTSRDAKRVYYLSLEFLVGRSLRNAVLNLGLSGEYGEALSQLGYSMEEIIAEEKEPALGNGGLGRLASCFMDSLASQNLPAWGYGIRYKYGMFEQRLIDGRQVEFPDYWLQHGNPWEVERLDVQYPIRMYGRVAMTNGPHGKMKFTWEGGEVILAVAYDTPVPGYRTYNTNNLRLWSSRPSSEFDLASFNAGHYYQAVEAKERSESISSVLYPSDDTAHGKELRLKQQYFFVSATLQDVLRRFKKRPRPLSDLPKQTAIQLNDTHPAIAVPELMRLLVDIEEVPWDEAWNITVNTMSYTNHTILPEALEKWPVPLLQNLLPRHLQIIFEINHRFLQQVALQWPGDVERLSRMSIIEESDPKMVRMATLAVVGSHTINGVAKIHSHLLTTRLFPDFYEMWPQRFQNKTNGVCPRRWLLAANPALSSLITRALGSEDWVVNMEKLQTLGALASDPRFQAEWRGIKYGNKIRLSELVLNTTGVQLDPEVLFDVHVKRIHEYKRQLMNVMAVIHRYHTIITCTPQERRELVPRAVIFAGKAAPGYVVAKEVIHLVTSVARVVNSDARVGNLLKVVYLENYNVSLAEAIIPASDVSQHISTAGMEASGTSNMKFVMNGGLILGTQDGANIEIAEAVGRSNVFMFGATATEVEELRKGTTPRAPVDDRLQQVCNMIHMGAFGHPQEFGALVSPIQRGDDYYCVAQDFVSYLETQAAIDVAFLNKEAWTRRCIECAARMGTFSSDRSIREYAEEIWKIQPHAFVPHQGQAS